MVKHSTLFQPTIGAALLSALLLSTSAHAGLLGGGAAGGLGGGLSGGLTPRSLNIDGQVAGQASRDGALAPSRDVVKNKAGDAVQTGKDAGQSGAAKAAETKSAVADGAHEQAGKLREQTGNTSGKAIGNVSGTAATRRADVSADGSGQASRTDRAVRADASAQGGVQR